MCSSTSYFTSSHPTLHNRRTEGMPLAAQAPRSRHPARRTRPTLYVIIRLSRAAPTPRCNDQCVDRGGFDLHWRLHSGRILCDASSARKLMISKGACHSHPDRPLGGRYSAPEGVGHFEWCNLCVAGAMSRYRHPRQKPLGLAERQSALFCIESQPAPSRPRDRRAKEHLH